MRLIKRHDIALASTLPTQPLAPIDLCAYCNRSLSQGMHIECSLLQRHEQLKSARQVGNPKLAFTNLFASSDLGATSISDTSIRSKE